MFHRMSNLQVTGLSSLATGGCFAAVLASRGSCPFGWFSVQLASLWVAYLLKATRSVRYSVRPEMYTENNSEFVLNSTAAAAPRLFVSKDPTVLHLTFVTLMLGVCDALAATIAPADTDAFVLAALSCLFAGHCKKVRAAGICVVLYKVAYYGLPGAPALLRICSVLFALLACNMNLSRAHIAGRFAISSLIVMQVSSSVQCTSWFRAIPPLLVLQAGVQSYRGNLPVILIITAALL
jgi:hypothetical protein